MIVALMTAVMVTAAPIETELEGVIELSRAPGGAVVILKQAAGQGPLRLKGEETADLRKLQSAKVRVRGKQVGQNLLVEAYDLISVYGKTPIVGQITEISGKIAIVDGDGPAILLNLAPRSYKRFLEARGHRSWVTGKLLLSGEFKVSRYGILRSRASVSETTSDVNSEEQK
tara:strand:- start:240 stop:755 length:516 start_codon:yes stop_codon:yes gene_type:complete